MIECISKLNCELGDKIQNIGGCKVDGIQIHNCVHHYRNIISASDQFQPTTSRGGPLSQLYRIIEQRGKGESERLKDMETQAKLN